MALVKPAFVDCTDHAVNMLVPALPTLSSNGAGKYQADGQGMRSGAAAVAAEVPITYNACVVLVEPDPIWVVTGSITH